MSEFHKGPRFTVQELLLLLIDYRLLFETRKRFPSLPNCWLVPCMAVLLRLWPVPLFI